MPSIRNAVGRNRTNSAADVKFVQERLNHHKSWLWPLSPPKPSGSFDDETHSAIVAFQTSAAAYKNGDGIVDVSGYTIQALEKTVINRPTHNVFSPVCWGRGLGLTLDDFKDAATTLSCEVAAMRAVAEVEAPRGPWDELGRPTILFERHKFAKHSGGKFNRSHSDISNPSWGGHGLFREQYEKLLRAAILDENAALKAASWGAFQILGENFEAAGHQSVHAFVKAILENEANHLKAFVSFIQSNTHIHLALKAKDWAAFARGYNGSRYAENAYDTKMKAAYDKFVALENSSP